MTGIALFSEGQPYASYGSLLPYSDTHTTGSWFCPPVGIYTLSAVSDAAGWQPITRKDSQTVFSVIIGKDGTNLVHLYGPEPPSRVPTVHWTSVNN